MEIHKLPEMTNGWFVGDFSPTALKTSKFEVAWKRHKKDEPYEGHFHKLAFEINLLVRGRMLMQDKEIVAGDIFVIGPWEVANPVFLEDCELVVIKTPSIIGDKYIMETKT